MTDIGYLLAAIAVMAVVTYLIRVLSMVIFKRKIENAFVNSFLYYVPYGVLAALIFPSIFSSVGSLASAIVGCAAALILALTGQKLLVVSAGAVGAVFVCELLMSRL